MEMIVVQQHYEVRWETSGSNPYNTRANCRTFTGDTAEADAVAFWSVRTVSAAERGHAAPTIRRVTIEERAA